VHYFIVRCVENSGSVIKLEAMLVHPDVETFGTERYFAWKLLSDFVSPADDADELTLARKLIERVELGPLTHGTETERAPGWFKVARVSDDEDAELPSVVYTLWVSDPSLIEPVQVGDSEESVAYVETDKLILDAQGGGAVAPTPSPKRGRKPASAKEPAGPLAVKSYDDLRDAILALVRAEARDRPDELIACLVRWAEAEDHERLSAWLAQLHTKEQGWFSEAAGRVAVQRLLAGDASSARRLLAEGEAAMPTEEQSERARATVGLMAAWWRLGESARAEAAWEALPADRANYCSEKDMAWAAALGGQVDHFVTTGEIGGMFDFATVEGLLALHADGVEVLADAIERCDDKGSSVELAEALLRRCIALGRPGELIELALRFPEVLASEGEPCVVVALEALSKTDPAAAVELALRVLADEDTFSFGYVAHPHVFALLARLAPERAERWAEACEEMRNPRRASRFAYLAALGRTAEVRAALGALGDLGALLTIAAATPDRALATEALRAYVDARRAKLTEIPVWALARLCDLGERDLVDALLDGELARLEALPPKDRDSGCRALCLRAASLGRFELARAAHRLPTKGVRFCSVQEIVRGAASVGDYAGVLAGLELFDERRYVLDAAYMSLRVIEASFVHGPRSMPFRALAHS